MGVIVLAVAVVVGWAWLRNQGLRPSGNAPPGPPSYAQPAVAAPLNPNYDNARRLLVELPVKGWDRAQDFKRYRFGERWSDDVNVEFGHNGCNTRD
ncbi:MAG: HNH endonuclease, partial [Mycobacterium sp.]